MSTVCERQDLRFMRVSTMWRLLDPASSTTSASANAARALRVSDYLYGWVTVVVQGTRSASVSSIEYHRHYDDTMTRCQLTVGRNFSKRLYVHSHRPGDDLTTGHWWADMWRVNLALL